MKKILFILVFLIQFSCNTALPLNPFDPESLIGFITSLDPHRYNPPPKSKIKVSGTLSSILEGDSFTFGVTLENNPYGSKEISISSNVSTLTFNGSSSTSLSFDSSNYSTEQLVTLKAGIDSDSNSTLATITLSSDGLDSQSFNLTITDDLAISVSGSVTSLQEGNTASFGVKLSQKPPSDKTVTISSNNSALTINSTSSTNLSFSSSNYDTIQSITLLAVIDANSTNESVTITFSMEGVPDTTYTLTIIDDTTIQVTNFPASLLEGTSQNIGVRFSKTLLASNSITVTSNNPAITLNGTSSVTLNYLTSNGTADQTITIASVIDSNLSSESVTLNFTATGMAPLILVITATDKDSQNLVVTSSITTLDEGTSANSGQIQVKLSNDPGGTATVTVTSSDTSSITIDPTTTFISFDSSNWNIPRNVNISAIEDTNESSETVNIIFSIPGAPLFIQNIIAVDNDTRILIGGSDQVSENGTNSLIVSLSGNPGINRTIALTSSNTSSITLLSASILMTPSNYSQTVVVQGVQDNNIVNESVTITGTCTGLTTGTRNITALDDDTMNILLTGSSTVSEGGTSTINVKLTQDPSTPLTVNLTSSNTSSVSLSASTVTLTSANYNTTGVNVTLTGVEDANESTETVTITASSGSYSSNIQIATQDNDTRPVFGGVTQITEETIGAITIQLSGDPGTTRVVNIASSDSTKISVITSALSFNSSNWNIPQAVTLSALADVNVVDETVVLTASGTGLTTVTYNIVSKDNDVLEMIVTNVGGYNLTEGDGNNPIKFKIKFNFQPSSNITISATSKNTSPTTPGYTNYKIISSNVSHNGLSTSFPNMVFTPANYNIEQEFTIYAIENLYIDDYNTQFYINSSGGFTNTITYDINVKDNDPIEHKVVTAGISPPFEKPSIIFDLSYTSHFLIIGTNSSDGFISVPGGSMCNLNLECTLPIRVGSINNIGYNINSLMTDTWSLVGLNKNTNKIVYFKSTYVDGWYPGNLWNVIPIEQNMVDSGQISNIQHTENSSIADPFNNKVIVATVKNNYSLSYFKFNYDASSPTYQEFSEEFTAPYLLIDSNNQKLITLGSGYTQQSVFKLCNLDISNCIDKNLSIDTGTGARLLNTFGLIDTVSLPNKLIIVGTSITTGEGPGGFICNLDGTNCSFFATGNGVKSGLFSKAIIDKINKKLLIVSYSLVDNQSAVLYRCELNGTNCKFRNLTSWLAPDAGGHPQPIIIEDLDPYKRKLRIVTQNNAYGKTLSMFSMLLYID